MNLIHPIKAIATGRIANPVMNATNVPCPVCSTSLQFVPEQSGTNSCGRTEYYEEHFFCKSCADAFIATSTMNAA